MTGSTAGGGGFQREHQRRRPRLPLLAGIALLHILALYGLARALAPDLTAQVEEGVVSAFMVTVTTPPPPPENRPEPDEGAQGDPGKDAVPQPVTQPKPPRDLREEPPRPRAASTGTASQSGATLAGDGTGAAGSVLGTGTGSGNGGGGRGGVAVSKPVHVSGAIDNARDFPVPPGGRAARAGTEVIVRVTGTPQGRATGCTIYRPSPDPEADRITCQLVESRLGFRPAMDAEGRPVAAPFYWRQRWF